MSEHWWRIVMVLAVTVWGYVWPSLAAAATWELLSPSRPDSFQARNLDQFANDVEQATAGQLRIVVLADPARLDGRQIKQAVAAGRAPAGELLFSDLRDEDAAFEADSIPFLATDYYEALRLWDASRPVLGRMLEAQGVHAVFAVASPPRGLFATKNITKMDDLRGLRLLDDNPFTRQLAILVEAVPTRVPGSMVQAFAAGEIDAAIASLPDGVAQQAWDVVDRYYDLGVTLPKSVVVFNRAAFGSLDPEVQRAVLNAAVAAQNRGWKASAQRTTTLSTLCRPMACRSPLPTLSSWPTCVRSAPGWPMNGSGAAAPTPRESCAPTGCSDDEIAFGSGARVRSDAD